MSGPPLSSPAMSSPAKSSVNVQSCNFRQPAVAIFLTCMSVRVYRPELFRNLCRSLVSGVPHFFLGLHPCLRQMILYITSGDLNDIVYC